MKNMFIVDDTPESKVSSILKYLKGENLDFNYTIKNSVLSACEYLYENANNIDLAIIDLGIPYKDNGPICTPIEGLMVIEEFIYERVKFPIIINSTTKVENKILKEYQKTLTIFQVENIWEVREKLLNYLKKGEHL